MKKLFLMFALTGMVSAASASTISLLSSNTVITVLGDDKGKKKDEKSCKKGEKSCKKDGKSCCKKGDKKDDVKTEEKAK